VKVSDIPCGDAPVGAVCFGKDGRWLAVGTDDGQVCVYEASSGRAVTEVMPHAKGVRQILFSTDEQSLITASRDGIIFIWPLMHPGDADRAVEIARSVMQEGGADRRFMPRVGVAPKLDDVNLRKIIANLAGGGAAMNNEITLLTTYLNSAAKPVDR
jgi:WD40 repeat protein